MLMRLVVMFAFIILLLRCASAAVPINSGNRNNTFTTIGYDSVDSLIRVPCMKGYALVNGVCKPAFN